MSTTQAHITVTELGPSKLLNRLATHWAHKLEVEQSPERARIVFPGDAVCVLQAADAQTLHARIDAPDAGVLDRLEEVVASHLLRMSRGEALEISWSRASA
ncbi:MAG TPA: DUF2218 domain-containing protein [Myxococcaceae bacterium]|nr:DUF2218 domain-containing protein [Myxococcaceae bacterium]